MQTIDQYKLDEANVAAKLDDPEWCDKNRDKSDYFKELYGISDEVLDAYYNAALKLMYDNRWEEAVDAFTFLIYLSSTIQRFWMGLGISLQTLKKFTEALQVYQVAEVLDPLDPFVHANSFQCCMALGDVELGKEYLRLALEYCDQSRDEYSELRGQLENDSKLLNQRS